MIKMIKSSDLIETSDILSDRPYYHYLLLSSKDVKPSTITREIFSYIFHNLGERLIFSKDNETISVVTVLKKFQFIIQKIDAAQYLLIYYNLSNESIKQPLENAIARIKWLVFTWMSPEDLDSFENYSSEYDVINLFTSYDPYYLLKKYSKIQPELHIDYHERWYKPRSIEVNIKIPKGDAREFLDTILQQKITETVKLRFKAKFSNPGEATIVIDKDGKVTHEHGELRATEKIVTDVIQKTNTKLMDFSKYATFRSYSKLSDGSFNLTDYKPTQPFYYTFKMPDEKIEEFSVKLENLLTISKKSLQIYGVRISRENRDFSCLTYIPTDRSELKIKFIHDDESPILVVDPLNASPLGILTLTRILSEKMTWSTKLSGFYE
jgi:hypothetical protein